MSGWPRQPRLRLVGDRGNDGGTGALPGRSDLRRQRVLLHAPAFGPELPLRTAAGLSGRRSLSAFRADWEQFAATVGAVLNHERDGGARTAGRAGKGRQR